MPTLSKPRATKKHAGIGRVRVLQAPNLKAVSWLVHGFSTREGGDSICYGGKTLNLGFTKDDARECVEKNRRALLVAVHAVQGDKPWPLILVKQVHSDLIHVVRSPEHAVMAGDGLVTSLPHVAIAVQTADCFPVLLADTRNRAVGAFHAGWRGTVKRIVEKGLGLMRHEYGTRPQDVEAAIGPGIQKCCYEVGEEVQAQFESQFHYGHKLLERVHAPDPVREKYPLLFLNGRPPGHGHPDHKIVLDLAEANRRQLLAMGVPEDQITVVRQCTSCNPKKFFSYRAEKGKTGRMMAVIGIR